MLGCWPGFSSITHNSAYLIQALVCDAHQHLLSPQHLSHHYQMLATAVFNLRSNILFFYPSIKRHQNCVSVLCGSPNWQPTFPFATRSPTCGKHLHGWTEVSLIAGSLAVDLVRPTTNAYATQASCWRSSSNRNDHSPFLSPSFVFSSDSTYCVETCRGFPVLTEYLHRMTWSLTEPSPPITPTRARNPPRNIFLDHIVWLGS